jgi:hypothetical protein
MHKKLMYIYNYKKENSYELQDLKVFFKKIKILIEFLSRFAYDW